jgi:hypothetical protein|tara:strand:+ start:1589 stop:2569 length:981 start_codon:yes stop_codon:yes gene_type:complete
MANKKITQLAGLEGGESVSGTFVFPVGAGNVSAFETKKVKASQIAEYVLNGQNPEQNSGNPRLGFAAYVSGTKDVYLNNSNWVDSSSAAGNTHAYIMVNKDNGLLTTGSGIGNPVGGDNMGNCDATTRINMQSNSIINLGDVRFQSAPESHIYNSGDKSIVVIGGRDLVLSGLRNVAISGQALDLADTPISGNVNFNNGNLTVATPGSLTIDEITVRKRSATTPHNNNEAPTNSTVDWSASSIQYMTAASSPTFLFSNTAEGQTLTMYVENTAGSDLTVGFPNTVEWGGEYAGASPNLVNGKTTLYTFVKINNTIFASAITGYVIS